MHLKYIYDPPEDKFKPGFIVGEAYEGNYENDPCFKPEKKKSSSKKSEKEVNNG